MSIEVSFLSIMICGVLLEFNSDGKKIFGTARVMGSEKNSDGERAATIIQ